MKRLLTLLAALACTQAHAYLGGIDPLVAMVGQAFGWTDAQVDDVFAEADAV